MSDCFKRNDLIDGGTRQSERFTAPLDQRYIVPDERSTADLIDFVAKYAPRIRYYAADGPGQKNYRVDGDWQSLILSDAAFSYAGIARLTPDVLSATFNKYVGLYEKGATPQIRFDCYRVWWDMLFSVYQDIDRIYKSLPGPFVLRQYIGEEILNGLTSDVALVASAYLNLTSEIPVPFATPPSPPHPFVFGPRILPDDGDGDYPFRSADDIITNGFDRIFIDPTTPHPDDWLAYKAVLSSRTSVADDFFQSTPLTDLLARVDYSTLQLKLVCRRALDTYRRIVSRAGQLLEDSIENDSSHQAHHGLLLTFLKLFGLLQQDMNKFTNRHLKYYYQKVLRLMPKPAIPDFVHVVIEPARNTKAFRIKKGTFFNAGKDGIGKQLLYGAANDMIVNQSKVADLKTIFLKPVSSDPSAAIEGIYGSSSPSSKDGAGAQFTTDDISWKCFGDERNEAAVGFFIAAPILHLTGGTRIITFRFKPAATGSNPLSSFTNPKDLISLFVISASGEKGWNDVPSNEDTISLSVDGNDVKLKITLQRNFPPIVGYDTRFCDGNLNTAFPVFRFKLNQAITSAYEITHEIDVNQITIDVNVSSMTNVSMLNDAGVLDPSKPLLVFGSVPKVGSRFYVGHPELGHKNLTTMGLSFDWLDLPANLPGHYSFYTTDAILKSPYVSISSGDDFKVTVWILQDAKWSQIDFNKSGVVGNTASLFLDDLYVAPSADKTPGSQSNFGTALETLTTETPNGFIAIELHSPAEAFGHLQWPKVFANQVLLKNATPVPSPAPATPANSLPDQPYTPVAKTLQLSYSANATLKFDGADGLFLHLTPFGNRLVTTGTTLVRTFNTKVLLKDKPKSVPMESALYIGVAQAAINQSISLLLKTNDGTEDASVDTPDVSWNYWSDGHWRNLGKNLIADSTKNLIRSGIVTILVPHDADDQSTELAAGLFWFRAAVTTGSSALPKMLTVLSNAVEATFMDVQNDPQHYRQPLPAGTISKLFEPQAEIKSVNQPFPSFGGNAAEIGNSFYTRASERLRHKHRAITIWDYERIVLDRFSEVYMVKCVNHAGYVTDCTTKAKNYKENIPGSVMLIPVPFVTNIQAGDKFRPSLSASAHMEIHDYVNGLDDGTTCNLRLHPLKCGGAKLIVQKPEYETISVTCSIAVKPCMDASYYQAQLEIDLNNFLSPWMQGDESQIKFGGSLHVSQIIYFMEQLDYIDYVEKVSMDHRDSENNQLNIADKDLAVTQKSISILTSSGSHTIVPI